MILSRDEEPIIAQCTPQGSGAIALLRLSGVTALQVATSLSILRNQQKLSEQKTHTIHVGSVIDERGVSIDQVMFLVMHAPKTFTGQDTVEITCHNNPFVIEQIIQRAVACGARIAHNGEFSKRAFLNNKIDLMQAEAINEFIHASHQVSLKQSLSQMNGSFSQWVVQLEKTLITCLALSEASFEFIDEAMEFGTTIREHITNVLEKIVMLKKTFDQQKQVRQGVRIALLGSVNAGKSSLFNALLNQKRSIVTAIAGTTRDSIEAGLYRNGLYWTLIDTAGLRETDDVIEKEGIQRSEQEAQLADIMILVYDNARAMHDHERALYLKLLEQYAQKTIVVANKSDLPAYSQNPYFATDSIVYVSCHDKQSIELLIGVIEDKISVLCTALTSPFLLNKRHFTLLIKLEQKLSEIMPMLQGTISYELLSYHIKDALECLTELTGKTISEQGMDAVFREFCVGK